MANRSSLHRTLEIIERLNNSKVLCVSYLAQEYEVSERTIRRDFEVIKDIYGNFVTKEGECYKAYEKLLLNKVLNSTDLMTLANIVNLFGMTQKDSQISDETKALVKESLTVYDFKTRPFEEVRNYEIVKKLEHAIKFNKEIKIEYQTERAITQACFQPYKISFLNENFYLVGINCSKGVFEYRRVTMIKSVEFTKKEFFLKHDVVSFIDKLQTPWGVFGKDEIKVRLRANVKIRRYFYKKKYLPSQKITNEFENGDIEVTYVVTNLREIEDIIIKWLPQISILSPQNLNKMIKRSLAKKLYSLDSEKRTKERLKNEWRKEQKAQNR